MIAALFICLAPVAIDGDTIKCGNTPQRVRIFGVNAPELSTAQGPASRDALQPVLAGGVECEIVGASYSRLVGICVNAAGQDISRLQLQSGHAVEWCSYSHNYYGSCTP